MKRLLLISLWILMGLGATGHAAPPHWMPHLNPEEIGVLLPELRQLDNFKALDLSASPRDGLVKVLPGLAQMAQLEALNLNNCGLLILPQEVIKLAQLRHLHLSQNQLKRVPAALFQSMNRLQSLDLSDNQLEALPSEIGGLKHLAHLNLRTNQLTQLPPRLNDLSMLAHLDMSWNRVRDLPRWLMAMPGLRCLQTEGNPLPPATGDGPGKQKDDCAGGRIDVLLTGPKQSRIEIRTATAEAKAGLLLALVREAAAQAPALAQSAEELLRYEVAQNMTTARRRAENRYTFLDFLLARLAAGSIADAGGLLDDYAAFAQGNWVSLASAAAPEEDRFAQRHMQQVFKWQLFSSKIIFWTVILIVAVGLVFSGIQFYDALKMSAPSDAGEKSPDTGSRSRDQTQIEITAKSVKVQTSVLGVAILVVSLAFFYLYLKFVYPIETVALKP